MLMASLLSARGTGPTTSWAGSRGMNGHWRTSGLPGHQPTSISEHRRKENPSPLPPLPNPLPPPAPHHCVPPLQAPGNPHRATEQVGNTQEPQIPLVCRPPSAKGSRAAAESARPGILSSSPPHAWPSLYLPHTGPHPAGKTELFISSPAFLRCASLQH